MMIRQSYHLYRRVSLLLLLVFCSIAVQAQNIAVKSFAIDETDMTANTTGTTVIDQNGQKCALIKMITTQTGFTFDAGSLGIVKTEQHVGEVWIYVPEGVKRLTISHPTLGQLRDYDLGQTLKRARTYVLYLKAGEVANVPQTQKLTIDYTPVNAMVLIDSKPFTGNGHLETVLPIGNHNYIIAAEGYESAEGSFKLTASAPKAFTEHLVASAQPAPSVVTQPTVPVSQISQLQPSAPAPQTTQLPVSQASSGPAVKTITVNGVSFNMIRVDGGTFQMGATSEQKKPQKTEKPVHEVILSPYYIGETEVTQELWQAVMGSNPSLIRLSQFPVEQVSWNDCQDFILKLNQQTGLKFSLPTEAQWEYAARGGNKSHGYQFSGSNNIDDVAWSYGSWMTHGVKTKQANELGIYDMSGNVDEWCQDRYGSYNSGLQTNPTGPSSGSKRVLRGGSWCTYAKYCRVATRDGYAPTSRAGFFGLRLALQ